MASRALQSSSPVAFLRPFFHEPSNSKINIMTRGKLGGLKNVQTVHQLKVTIEEHWKSIPEQARAFLIETPLNSLTLHRFTKFWTSPNLVKHVRSQRLAGSIRDASLSIALNSLYLGKVEKARALMLNGSFMLECMDTGIERICKWCRDNANTVCTPELLLFSHALNLAKTPEAMEKLLQRMIRMFHNSSQKQVIAAVGNPKKRNQSPPSKPATESIVQLILVDTINTDDRQTLNIGSSTTLKTLFNHYAEKRGVSLRSLRFSYGGQTLFLSNAGNRTPDQLKMKDQDVITVSDTNDTSQSTDCGSSPKKKKPKAKKRRHARKKIKGRGKKEQNEVIKTLGDYKAHHSTILSKLHEEVQAQLKEIRIRLNALDLERQPPKQKRKSKREKKVKADEECQISLPKCGVGGKAGKPYFIVQVGEVQNLYKTTKPSLKRYSLHSADSTTLDLHGCSREEAAAKLDSSLATWIDTAMMGGYPWVIPAKIICGCGNQILSETVEKWIRERAQVANARKNSASGNIL